MKPSRQTGSLRSTPPRLRDVQAAVASAIIRPLAPRGRMQPASRATANRFIKPNDRLTSFERLEIYNRQYWFRLLDCFYDDYPGLRAVLGDRKFDRLARAYLARYPSGSFSLRNLGGRLEKFLREEPKWTVPHGELALDMARLEWAHIVAFDEAAHPVIDVDDLLGRDPSRVRLALQPYITLLDVSYPVDDLLLAAKKGDDGLRAEASNAVELRHKRAALLDFRRLKPQPLYIAVHRMNLSVYYKPLTREQFEVLCALQRGATLEKACAKAVRPKPAAVQKWFQSWTSFGWFCRR
ncbi:MAG TPA: DNA-binding domain-containing protein [Verrucomicrobiae bacterium]|nr:DNA-binding domain-containing protein [Verrucomicrobiae bacterium]